VGNVLVMTDTVSCIPKELAEKKNIKIVPAANIHYNGVDYIDGATISAREAYEFIKKDPDRFITSALQPGVLMEEFSKVSSDAQNILFISLSSALSALNRTASIAAEQFQERSPQTTIQVFDSRTVASSQGLIALAVAEAASKGMSLNKLVDIAEKVRQQTGGVMMLDTLRYVYRTGRMSKMGSKIASLFNIKPINEVTDEGKVEMVDRTRNREHGLEILLDYIEQKSTAKSLHFMITHAAAPDIAEQFSEMLQKKFTCLSLIISDYSPVMGYGAGPGAIFVGFRPELDY
jgi:DegV family protein with EDD domain